ncbi:hypothetical protein BU15DRAFT_88824 [Melanogaster broomeanus]|nr:hypothetical protein BU15DRAFT_88824 [Melanogaster broomeanus]
MPSLTLPECPVYVAPPPTQLDLDFADLAIIDLSKAHTPEGRAELAPELRDALRTNGFVYAINHGYTQAQRDRVFDIADVPFTAVPPEEMKIYTANIEKVGHYAGYKARQFWALDTDNGIRDQIEQYVLNRIVTQRPHPQALRPFLPEIDAFARHNHFNVLHPILSCPRRLWWRSTTLTGPEQQQAWLSTLENIGSVTILWSQPVSGLQILPPDGKWRWVRHIDNALVINTGDMMDFFTGGFYKPTIHHLEHFYFTMADDDRAGIERHCPDDEAPLSGVWRKERTTTYGRSELKKAPKRMSRRKSSKALS